MVINLADNTYKIAQELLNSYYINHHESQIKIDSEGYNILFECNNKYNNLKMNILNLI